MITCTLSVDLHLISKPTCLSIVQSPLCIYSKFFYSVIVENYKDEVTFGKFFVKVVIYAGCIVRIFYGQTIHNGTKYADALFTTLIWSVFYHTRGDILHRFKLTM